MEIESFISRIKLNNVEKFFKLQREKRWKLFSLQEMQTLQTVRDSWQ